jgi:hypothetical protein
MRQIDLQFIKETLLELDPTWEGSEPAESYQTALVLVSALVCGSDTEGLAGFTQLPRTFVETIRHRMIRAELWTESDVFYAHWFGEGNLVCTTAVWLDVLIGQGLVVRKWDEDAGDYRYCHFAYELAANDPQQKVN